MCARQGRSLDRGNRVTGSDVTGCSGAGDRARGVASSTSRGPAAAISRPRHVLRTHGAATWLARYRREFHIHSLHYTTAVQPVATCRQSLYLRKPAIVVVTSFSL